MYKARHMCQAIRFWDSNKVLTYLLTYYLMWVKSWTSERSRTPHISRAIPDCFRPPLVSEYPENRRFQANQGFCGILFVSSYTVCGRKSFCVGVVGLGLSQRGQKGLSHGPCCVLYSRWIAAPLIWFTIFAVIALLIFGKCLVDCKECCQVFVVLWLCKIPWIAPGDSL